MLQSLARHTRLSSATGSSERPRRVNDDTGPDAHSRCPPECLSCFAASKSTRESDKHEVHDGYPAVESPFWLVDLHADSATPHDFVTSEGSFERTLALLEQAKSEDQTIEVRTWLTRATFRHLGNLPALLMEARVRTWHLHALPWGVAAVPRLAMAWPEALRAAKEAELAGIHVSTYGAPHCVLGPFSRLASQQLGQAFGAKCEGCNMRKECVGVDEGYLERFGDEDLRAIRS